MITLANTTDDYKYTIGVMSAEFKEMHALFDISLGDTYEFNIDIDECIATNDDYTEHMGYNKAILKDNKIIGSIFFEITDNTVVIDEFIIDKAYRGKGYALESFNIFLCTECKSVKKLHILVHKSNDKAISFWSKVGFRTSDAYKNHGNYINMIRYK